RPDFLASVPISSPHCYSPIIDYELSNHYTHAAYLQAMREDAFCVIWLYSCNEAILYMLQERLTHRVKGVERSWQDRKPKQSKRTGLQSNYSLMRTIYTSQRK